MKQLTDFSLFTACERVRELCPDISALKSAAAELMVRKPHWTARSCQTNVFNLMWCDEQQSSWKKGSTSQADETLIEVAVSQWVTEGRWTFALPDSRETKISAFVYDGDFLPVNVLWQTPVMVSFYSSMAPGRLSVPFHVGLDVTFVPSCCRKWSSVTFHAPFHPFVASYVSFLNFDSGTYVWHLLLGLLVNSIGVWIVAERQHNYVQTCWPFLINSGASGVESPIRSDWILLVSAQIGTVVNVL